MSAQPRLTETSRPISGIIKESWSLVDGFKTSVFVVFLMNMAFIFINGIVFVTISYTIIFNIFFFRSIYPDINVHTIFQIMFVINIFLGIIAWFIMTMLIMLGVRRALALPFEIPTVFNECKSAASGIFILYLIIVFLVVATLYIGYMVRNLGISGELICVGWLLFTSYISLSLLIFTVPLIVTKRCAKVTDAINDGFQMMNANWKKVIPVVIIMSIIVSLSAVLLLGIGLVWSLPMFFAATGICFRNAYDLKNRLAINT